MDAARAEWAAVSRGPPSVPRLPGARGRGITAHHPLAPRHPSHPHTGAPRITAGLRPHHDGAAHADFRRAADSLGRADAERDVAAALRRGDRRLLGVQRYVLLLPGLPAERSAALERAYGVRVLGGSSDSWVGDDHAAYNRATEAYAERYNRALRCRLGAG